MIVSVHIADVGLRSGVSILRRGLDPGQVPGLVYAETMVTAPIGEKPLPAANFGRVGLISAWESDAALDEFDASHPLGARFAGGWQVRLQPLRVSGRWAAMPGLPEQALAVDDEEPVVVLTLGRLRLLRALPFVRSAAPAEGEVAKNPALLASTGFAHPPHIVSTFSVWRSAAAMKEYSYARSGAHQAAVRADRDRPFHHESAFIRFRPYASRGIWEGRDPLAAALSAAAPAGPA